MRPGQPKRFNRTIFFGKAKDKLGNPEFKARVGEDLWMIHADLDIPMDLEFLRSYYAGIGWAWRSCGGNTKITFLVQSPHMNHRIAKATLQKYLAEEHFKMIDDGGILGSFIPPSAFAGLSRFLQSAKPLIAIDEHTWNPVDLPKNVTGSELRRFILAMVYQKPEGVDLPSPYIASQTGATTRDVLRERMKLEKEGKILCVDNSYCKGRKGKTYKGVGSWVASRRARLLVEAIPQMNIVATPSKTIAPGEWFKVLWDATRLFNTSESYYKWVSSVPGCDKKGRLSKAKSAWNGHIKNTNNWGALS